MKKPTLTRFELFILKVAAFLIVVWYLDRVGRFKPWVVNLVTILKLIFVAFLIYLIANLIGIIK